MASSTLTVLDVGLDSPNVLPDTVGDDYYIPMHSLKGKSARSWQDLPAEIVRLIINYYLLDVCANAYIPKTWEPRELWPQRLAFTTFRDAVQMAHLRKLVPWWKPHLENHAFWNKAVAVLDPMGAYNHLTVLQPTPTAGSNCAAAQRIPMQHHFNHMLVASCIVCRINSPYNGEGLCIGSEKHRSITPWFGQIRVCKEHQKGASFCGVCLREAPRVELEEDYAQGMPVCCVENEDDETWPKVEATCRTCRAEYFWRRVSMRPEWQIAVDQRQGSGLDWETRQSVESFIDLGEGVIREVLQLAEEKHWLRSYTKIADMLQQALAASRFASRVEAGEVYGSEDELSEDEMEDPEMMSLTEDAGGIRELAVNDWVRNRILDGHWISPADDFYHNTEYGRSRLAPARHPCPWNRRAIYEGALDDGQGDEAQELPHPRPKTHGVPHPPTFALAQQTYYAFQRQMREILLPPMRNLIRKLMMESTLDGFEAGMRAHNMTIEEIVNELRDESVWHNGVDWFEVRQNRLAFEEERRRSHGKEREDDDSSSSSRSGGSHTTSPVLSTTTLQTTPSPPPVNKDDDAVAVSSPIVGAPPAAPLHFSHLHSPSLRASELLRPIPYVPVTTDHMPHYSREAFSVVWREACAPLWNCQCTICERAMLNANVSGSEAVPTQAQLAAQAQQQQPQRPFAEIHIQEAPAQPLEEEEEDLDESEDESDSLDCESERGEVDEVTFAVAPIPTYHPTSRKRPSSDLEPDTESDSFSLTTATDPSDRSDHSHTPPKRMKREGSYDHSASLPLSPSVTSTTSTSAPPPSSSPLGQRQRKRSSEELEVDDQPPISGKRMRGDEEPPRTPSVKGVELELEPRTPSKECEPRVSRLSATPTATAVAAAAARGQPAVAGVVPAL